MFDGDGDAGGFDGEVAGDVVRTLVGVDIGFGGPEGAESVAAGAGRLSFRAMPLATVDAFLALLLPFAGEATTSDTYLVSQGRPVG